MIASVAGSIVTQRRQDPVGRAAARSSFASGRAALDEPEPLQAGTPGDRARAGGQGPSVRVLRSRGDLREPGRSGATRATSPAWTARPATLALLGELRRRAQAASTKRMTQLLSEAKSSAELEKRPEGRPGQPRAVRQGDRASSTRRAEGRDRPSSRQAPSRRSRTTQFAVYQGHFAGEPRDLAPSRAPHARSCRTLKDIHQRMLAFQKSSPELEFNAKNISDRRGPAQGLRERSSVEIRKLRQSDRRSPDIMGELGGAANKLFDRLPQGRTRTSRANQVDIEKLGNCSATSSVRSGSRWARWPARRTTR